jgi:hypothetical protein
MEPALSAELDRFLTDLPLMLGARAAAGAMEMEWIVSLCAFEDTYLRTYWQQVERRRHPTQLIYGW